MYSNYKKTSTGTFSQIAALKKKPTQRAASTSKTVEDAPSKKEKPQWNDAVNSENPYKLSAAELVISTPPPSLAFFESLSALSGLEEDKFDEQTQTRSEGRVAGKTG